jgi:glycosyltransferase involved in cell wall biosynthesis
MHSSAVKRLSELISANMNRNINLLILAYVFPPALGSGSFRPLSFANNLQLLGLGVYVLTASDYRFDDSAIDQTLCEKLNPRVEVHRAPRYRSPKECLLRMKKYFTSTGNKSTSRLRDTNNPERSSSSAKVFDSIRTVLTDLLSYPDNQIGWALAAFMLGRKLIRDKHIDIVLATGGPWSCILTAILLKKVSRVPVVLDFRDPWVSNPNALNHSATFRSLDGLMEAFCVKHCDAVIANTEELRRDFLDRYPWLDSTKIHTITNGFDSLYTSQARRNEKFTITHAGVFYLSRNPKQFLLAIREMIVEARIPHDRIQVNFVGTLEINDEELAPLFSDEHLKNVVRIVPFVSHDIALQIQSMSDVLMLIQPDFPLQVPRKLFEYLAFQRPILAITEQSGATASTIRKAGVGIVVSNEVSEIRDAILNLYQRWIHSTRTESPQAQLLQFNNSLLADKLRIVLEGVLAERMGS